jgi:hypothetical protein
MFAEHKAFGAFVPLSSLVFRVANNDGSNFENVIIGKVPSHVIHSTSCIGSVPSHVIHSTPPLEVCLPTLYTAHPVFEVCRPTYTQHTLYYKCAFPPFYTARYVLDLCLSPFYAAHSVLEFAFPRFTQHNSRFFTNFCDGFEFDHTVIDSS